MYSKMDKLGIFIFIDAINIVVEDYYVNCIYEDKNPTNIDKKNGLNQVEKWTGYAVSYSSYYTCKVQKVIQTSLKLWEKVNFRFCCTQKTSEFENR